MPRAGKAYSIDDMWRTRVRSELTRRGWSQFRLAKEAKCPRSLVSELLSSKLHQTTYLPELHRALGWPEPQPPLASPDAGELMYLWERMDEIGKQDMIERGRSRLDVLLKKAGHVPDKKKRQSD